MDGLPLRGARRESRARPSPGAPAPTAAPEHREAAAPCAGVPPLRRARARPARPREAPPAGLAARGCGRGGSCAEAAGLAARGCGRGGGCGDAAGAGPARRRPGRVVRGGGRWRRESDRSAHRMGRGKCGAEHIAPLRRLIRKEIRVSGRRPGCGSRIPTHEPHPAYPRRVRSRTAAHRRRTHKAPHGLHALIRCASDAYPTSYSLIGEAERGETFHFWPKPRGDLL